MDHAAVKAEKICDVQTPLKIEAKTKLEKRLGTVFGLMLGLGWLNRCRVPANPRLTGLLCWVRLSMWK